MRLLLEITTMGGVLGGFFWPGARGGTIETEKAPPPAKGRIDFQRDIRPLFEARCYECHGDKKQKSGLRLDRRQSVLRGGDSGKPAVVAGRSGERILLQQNTSTGPEEITPPQDQ